MPNKIATPLASPSCDKKCLLAAIAAVVDDDDNAAVAAAAEVEAPAAVLILLPLLLLDVDIVFMIICLFAAPPNKIENYFSQLSMPIVLHTARPPPRDHYQSKER